MGVEATSTSSIIASPHLIHPPPSNLHNHTPPPRRATAHPPSTYTHTSSHHLIHLRVPPRRAHILLPAALPSTSVRRRYVEANLPLRLDPKRRIAQQPTAKDFVFSRRARGKYTYTYPSTHKAMASTDAKPADAAKAQSETQAQPPAEQQKPTSTALGEDDEFEDFPVDGAFLLCPLLTSTLLSGPPLFSPPVTNRLA